MPNSEKTEKTQTEPEQEKRSANADDRLCGIIIALCVLIIGLWYLWGRYFVLELAEHLRNKLPPEIPTVALTLAELGQVGDLFGGINALFGALAFIGVGCAAYYQRQTYFQQLEDSKVAKDAFEKSYAQQLKDSNENKDALEKSNATNAALLSNANHELFVNVFLRMMEELHKTVRNIDLTNALINGQKPATTDEGLQKIETKLSEIGLQLSNSKWTEDDVDRAKQEIEKTYYDVFNLNSKTLRPFFKNFYQTFSLIEESGLSYSHQDKYAQIALASIDEKFMLLVMMNGLTNTGKPLQEQVERYGLLEKFHNHDARSAKANELGTWFYAEQAFQSPEEREFFYDNEIAIEKQKKRLTARLELLAKRQQKRSAQLETEVERLKKSVDEEATR